jgi:signal transduction histidine kinase
VDIRMAQSRGTFVGTTVGLVLASLGVLVIIAGASIWLALRTESDFAQLLRARAIRTATVDLMSLIQDAETGQRGYLLTHDQSYLVPYTQAVAHFDQLFSEFRGTVADSPDLRPATEQLSSLLRLKLAELKTTVDLARNGQFASAMSTVNGDTGKDLMNQARVIFAELLERSDDDLKASIAAQREAIQWLRLVAVGGAIVIVAMAGAAAWIITKYTRDLLDARSELEMLNADLEERVRLRTDGLARANAEIQRFAYIVTHDLRSPLVNIMGFTSELEAGLKPLGEWFAKGTVASDAVVTEAKQALTTDMPEAIGFIRSSTAKMDRLVNAILKISREGARTLRPERIDVGTLLDAAAASVHHQTTPGGGAVTVDSQAGEIITDRLSLEQIVYNLIDNAVKYRAPDRPIEIRARTRRSPSGQVTIAIEDNGRGIAESDRERVFELFRRSGEQDISGEGIGLAYVRTLVRNLGGEITLKSQLGLGSTFTVLLPPRLETSGGTTQ